MCGITGYLDRSASTGEDELLAVLGRMTDSLEHRGPDDRGLWCDAQAGIALGHCRLSVIDLSPAGHQPMHSPCGRWSLVYNGEIYNHGDLRRQLQGCGHTFQGHSDTEILLAGIAAWGIEQTVAQCIGMFAFAVWDHDRRELTLVRDRLGIKPLYYGWMGEVFLFGSELKALRLHPAFRREISREALSLYVYHNYVPAPYSIYQGISKLPPGTQLQITADSARPGSPEAYWSLKEVAENGGAAPFVGPADDALQELDYRMRGSIRLRMAADVPWGAFLSGGIDSSAVVALMQAESSRPVKTFTMGFEEPGYDEAGYAKAVADHLGTDHTACYVTSAEARDVIPLLPTIYDEPFGDSSQIPTYLVSHLARQDVTVCLSGDGGDELFGGYDRYFRTQQFWSRIRWFPALLRRTAAKILRGIPTGKGGILRRKALTLAELLSLANLAQVYARLQTHWHDPPVVVRSGSLPQTPFDDPRQWADCEHLLEKLMYVDSVTYLPDDILTKVDRASMAVSLEVRVPLLDHRLVEFAWSLPLDLKVQRGQSKWLLRQLLARYVPPALTERPKIGFGVPIGQWLRGPLRPWAEDLLDPRRLEAEGFFHPDPIRETWQAHLDGRQDWQYRLWDILMFQAWLAAGG